MKIIKIGLIVWFIITCTIYIHAQTIEKPYYALKSHETLEVRKIELTPEKTIISLSVENRIVGGTFCADRNIFITDPVGGKLKLKKSAGIPVCPETYKFKSIGEKLQFTLEFPPLPKSVKWIDVTEECSDNCFSLYGVVLNSELNGRLDEAVELAGKNDYMEAIASYSAILTNLSSTDEGIKGALYTDIITLLVRTGDRAGAAEWYKKMVNSRVPRLDLFIANLNSRGIKF
jgi:hypothetical protein